MKKRLSAILLSLCLVLVYVSASAATTVQPSLDVDLTKYSVSTGNIVGIDYADITAPWSGTLKTFDHEAGDDIEAGEIVFEMLETDVTAPEDGTVSGIFAEEGENAGAANSVYGRVAAVTPDENIRITCTYYGAYNDDEHKMAHIGEHVYLKANNTDKDESEGIVISADEKGYVVQVTGNSFKVAQNVNVYRDSQMTKEKCIGSGYTAARPDDSILPPVPGVVTEVVAPVGTSVKKGDTILRLSGQDADRGASAKIAAPISGTITQLAVSPGQQVWKGQLLARVYDKSNLEIVAETDEVDLKNTRVGDRLPITLDAYPSLLFYGTVTKISSVGVKKQNAAYYNVHIKLEDQYPISKGGLSDPGCEFRIGQTASVYTFSDDFVTAGNSAAETGAKQ